VALRPNAYARALLPEYRLGQAQWHSPKHNSTTLPSAHQPPDWNPLGSPALPWRAPIWAGWLDIVKLAWSPHEDFDFDGQFFTLKGVRAKPKHYGGTPPLIMNAEASATGQAFAIRNGDALFSTIAHGISFEETAGHVSRVRALNDKKQVREIAAGRFIANAEAVLLLGPPALSS
jgi:alkanesulfonate monooxygenase SsuD/methylene tetrahydromethanopterin reductase-like flavin-dependent oxidoreductase (luciferase family)